MGLNVLIVDDSAVMRQVIAKTLRLSGISISEIHQADNGKTGLAVLDAHWIDLILVDINMPVMNGQEMIERIRNRPESADTPVIVISTDGSETRMDMMNRCRAGFVQKPFTPEILRDQVLATMGVTYDEFTAGQATGSDGPDF
jgi:two-component system chemotaxis response regulator CheY